MKKVLTIPVAYIAFSIAWILITDSLEREFTYVYNINNYQTIKGIFFVYLSGILIFSLTYYAQNKINKVVDQLKVIQSLKNSALEQDSSFTWVYNSREDKVYFQGFLKDEFFKESKDGRKKLLLFYDLLTDFTNFSDFFNELLLGKNQSCTVEHKVHINSKTLYYECHLIRIELGRNTYITCHSNNITKIKKLLRDLTESKKLISSIIHSIPDLLILIENTSYIVKAFFYQNEEDILVKKEDLIEQDLTIFLPEHLADELKRRLSEDPVIREPFNYELKFNNKRQWYEARFIPHDNKHTLIIIRNITNDVLSVREKEMYFTQLKNAEEVLNFAYWSYDSFSKESFLSEKLETILGYEVRSLNDVKNLMQYIHRDDLSFVNENYKRILNKEPLVDGIIKIKSKNGSYRHILHKVKSITNGEKIAYSGVFVDVTKEVTTEFNLKEKTRLLNVLSNYTNDIIFVYKPEKRQIEYLSESAKKFILEEDIESVKKNFFEDYISNPHYMRLQSIVSKNNGSLQNELKNTFKSEMIFNKFKNTPVWVECSLFYHMDEQQSYILGVLRDIHEARLNYERLQVANMRFSNAVRASTDAIWDWDLLTNKFEWTENLKTFFGHSVESMEKSVVTWLTLIHPDDKDKVYGGIREAIADKRNFWESEYRMLDSSGNFRYVLNRAILMTNENEVYRIIGAIHDITTEKEAFVKLSNQNKILREIAWTQSHLVRAPLARLLGLIEMYDELGENMDEKDINQLIYASAKELDEIIHLINNKTQEAR